MSTGHKRLGELLVRENLKTITGPISELVLDLLAGDGRVLDSFGWPWTGEAFYDGPLSRALVQEGIRPGRMESPQTVRVLRVPRPAAATFLLFSQTRVSFAEQLGAPGSLVTLTRTVSLQRIGIALYPLESPAPPIPPLPDFAEGLGSRPLPGKASPIRPQSPTRPQ